MIQLKKTIYQQEIQDEMFIQDCSNSFGAGNCGLC